MGDGVNSAFTYLHRAPCPVIDIVVTGYLSGIVAVLFNYLGKVVIDGVEYELVLGAPCNGHIKSVTGSACPEYQLISALLPVLEIFDKSDIGLTECGPVAETESSVEVHCDYFMFIHSQHLRFRHISAVLPAIMCNG